MAAHAYHEEFRRYQSAQLEWQQQAGELWRFVHGEQFTASEREELERLGFATVPINVLFPAVEQAVSLLTANNPAFQVTAREDTDRRIASVISALLNYIWVQSQARAELKRAVRDYYIMGRGVIKAYWDPEADYGRGEIIIRAVNPLAVYPSPNTQDQYWRDAESIFCEHLLSKDQILQRWSDAGPLLEQLELADETSRFLLSLTNFSSDPQRPLYRVLERYGLDTLVLLHIRHRDTGYEEVTYDALEEVLGRDIWVILDEQLQPRAYVTTPYQVERYASLYEQGEDMGEGVRRIQLPPPQEGMPPALLLLRPAKMAEAHAAQAVDVRRAPVRRCRYTIIMGQEIYWEGYIETDTYPVVPLQGIAGRSPYPLSDVALVKDVQRLLNKLYMLVLANIQTGNSPKILVPRGAINLDEWLVEMRRPGVAVLQYDPMPDTPGPTVVAPQPLPNMLLSTIEGLISLIERKLGIYSVMQGDPKQAPYTYRGTLAIDEYGQRRIRSKLDDIEGALVQLGRAVLQMAQAYYTTEKTFRIVAPNGITQTYQIGAPYDDLSGEVVRVRDISTGNYDVIVVSGSTLPSNRWLLQDYYLQLYQAGVIDDIEVLKKSEVVDAEGVMARKTMMMQLMAQIQQLERMVERMSRELAKSDAEIVKLKRKLQVDTFRHQLQSFLLDLKKAKELFEARTADELRRRREMTELERRLVRLTEQLARKRVEENGREEMDSEGDQAAGGLQGQGT